MAAMGHHTRGHWCLPSRATIVNIVQDLNFSSLSKIVF